MAVGALTLASAGAADPAPTFDGFAPLTAPLPPPLGLTASFGEHRSRRFHAGLDFTTGEAVGREVLAPADGWVERVRASGVGYGRSLYLRAADGRLFVFAHLDAFDGALADWVADAQEAEGRYEQDLHPPPGRFAVRTGERIAWSGDSGAGPPHLHFEVRRGDMNYNPLRAGLAAPDTRAPQLVRLTLEPLDDTSYVERTAAPRTVALVGAPETLLVQGRARAWLETVDGDGVKAARMAPYGAALTWGGRTVACVLDSVAWGDEMPEADWVFDAARRAAPRRAIGLWHSAEFRPAVFGRAGAIEESGTIAVAAGDPPRPLALEAWDAAGNRTRRTVWVRGPSPRERGPDPARSGAPARARAVAWSWSVLPGRFVRVTLDGAPAGLRELRARRVGRDAIERAAAWRAGRLVAVVPLDGVAGPCSLAFVARHADGSTWSEATEINVVPLGGGGAAWNAVTFADAASGERFEWRLPPGGAFESAVALARPAAAPARGGAALTPRSAAWSLAPSHLPLRRAASVRLEAPGAGDDPRIGLYLDDGDGWSLLRASREGAAWTAEASRLGRFALFADTLAPVVTPLRPAAGSASGPYSRWRIEASVAESGSGLDADASHFVINGVRVPTEWDPDARRLRWRPRARPAAGTHRVEVVAVDRAGNVARRTRTVVLD